MSGADVIFGRDIRVDIDFGVGLQGTKGDTYALTDDDREEIAVKACPAKRVESLDETPFVSGTMVDVTGIPVYVSDVSEYSEWGLTETGWYAFARINLDAPIEDVEPIPGPGDDPVMVFAARDTSTFMVTGADGVKPYAAGDTYVDVAVRFDVAAESKIVTVGDETFVFRASDLAIRNLDYRTTFYVYDASPFVTWEYAPISEETIAADKRYYKINTVVFDRAVRGKDYNAGDEIPLGEYYVGGSGKYFHPFYPATERYFNYHREYYKPRHEYLLVEVTAGEAAPVTYYDRVFVQTRDATFQDGKSYYTLNGTTYAEATVTVGEEIPADTYYEPYYWPTTDPQFMAASIKSYYILNGTTYEAAEVTEGASIPKILYNHSKIIISGLARNITYRLDEIIDCPMEFILPEIEDETHGCWVEIRCRHAGEYSTTLTPPSSDVKIATEHTQKETAGINMIDLHYTVIDGLKIWRFLNTHSSIPAEAST